MPFHEHFFVITGAPGSGKTTLLHSLEDRYFLIMPEGGRSIIKNQTDIGGTALPWENKSAYADLLLNWDMRSYHEAPRRHLPVLFDRGIPDVIGYLEMNNILVPEYMVKAAEQFRYNRKVFIAPHWPEIYEKDSERKQSHEESEATFNAMMKVYERLGYELLTLPRENLNKRVQFVMDHLRSE